MAEIKPRQKAWKGLDDHDFLLTASIQNVIKVFFPGLKNSVSTGALRIKDNTFIVIESQTREETYN